MLLLAVTIDQWDVQPTIVRLNASLIARGYQTWFDRECYRFTTTAAAAAAAAAALLCC